jgi:hypothetical protein
VPGRQGRRAAAGCLGQHHAERLRERARDDHGLRHAHQLGHVVVLDPPGEVHPAHGRRRGGQIPLLPGAVQAVQERGQEVQLTGRPTLEPTALAGDAAGGGQVAPAQRTGQLHQPGPVAAEAGDDQPGRRDLVHHQRPGRDEQVHAFGHDELADEADDPVLGRVRGQQRLRGAGIAAPRGRVGLQPRGQRGEPGRRLVQRARGEPAGVHSRRQQPGPGGQAGHVHHFPQALGGVPGADQHAGRAEQAFPGVTAEPALVRAHRVLERRPVDLDRVRDLAVQRTGHDHRSHHQMIGQRRIRLGGRDDLADRDGVGPDVALDLGVSQVRKRLRLETGIAVRHIDRQQAADIGQVDGAPDRLTVDLDTQLAIFPPAYRVHEIQFCRLRVLAEKVDFMVEPDQPAGQFDVVNVTSGAPQEIAVEYQNTHRH